MPHDTVVTVIIDTSTTSDRQPHRHASPTLHERRSTHLLQPATRCRGHQQRSISMPIVAGCQRPVAVLPAAARLAAGAKNGAVCTPRRLQRPQRSQDRARRAARCRAEQAGGATPATSLTPSQLQAAAARNDGSVLWARATVVENRCVCAGGQGWQGKRGGVLPCSGRRRAALPTAAPSSWPCTAAMRRSMPAHTLVCLPRLALPARTLPNLAPAALAHALQRGERRRQREDAAAKRGRCSHLFRWAQSAPHPEQPALD